MKTALILTLLGVFVATSASASVESPEQEEELEDPGFTPFRCEVQRIVSGAKKQLALGRNPEKVWKIGAAKTKKLIDMMVKLFTKEFNKKITQRRRRLMRKFHKLVHRHHVRILYALMKEMKKHGLHEFAARIKKAIAKAKAEFLKKHLGDEEEDDKVLDPEQEEDAIDDLEEVLEDAHKTPYKCEIEEIVRLGKFMLRKGANKEKVWKVGEAKTHALIQHMMKQIKHHFVQRYMKMYRKKLRKFYRRLHKHHIKILRELEREMKKQGLHRFAARIRKEIARARAEFMKKFSGDEQEAEPEDEKKEDEAAPQGETEEDAPWLDEAKEEKEEDVQDTSGSLNFYYY